MKKIKTYFETMKLNIKFTLIIVTCTALPIAIMAGIIFYDMEQNAIEESITYMEYAANRNYDAVENSIDSINMSTQFFLSDERLEEVLVQAVNGQTMTTTELLDFYENDVADLERLVNNNPLLYSVRVFGINDNLQEMMPVLYGKSRMEKLSWAKEETVEGWHFGYYDTTFSTSGAGQNDRLVSLVTPVEVYKEGVVGYIEAAVYMENIFPNLYEDMGNQWACFVRNDGTLYLAEHAPENATEMVEHIRASAIQTSETTTYFEKIDYSNQFVITYLPLKELGGVAIYVQDITDEIEEIYFFRNTFVAVMVFVLFLLAVLINVIVKHMLRHFYVVLQTMTKVENGDLSIRVDLDSRDEMGQLASGLNNMLARIEKLMQDNINREVLAKNSEIRALQNQINAHFIYNVLETIKMMAEIDEEYEIADAITSLGKLLRYSMRWVSGNVTVAEELEYIRNYMSLMNLRFDFEVFLSVNIPEPLLSQEIPKMSLQPIVENAVLHGIEQMAEDSNIYIKGRVEGEDCILEVSDAGKGMTPEQVEALMMRISGKIETTGGKGNGIGLKNVQDRIVMAFGKEYGISIASKEECYTKISMRIPFRTTRR